MDALDLDGSRWVAVEVGGRAALADAAPNAAFEIDGRVYGSTGVNRFSATYSLVGDELTMGQAVSDDDGRTARGDGPGAERGCRSWAVGVPRTSRRRASRHR